MRTPPMIPGREGGAHHIPAITVGIDHPDAHPEPEPVKAGLEVVHDNMTGHAGPSGAVTLGGRLARPYTNLLVSLSNVESKQWLTNQ